MTFKKRLDNLPDTIRAGQKRIMEDIEEVRERTKVLWEEGEQLAFVWRTARALSQDWRCSVPGHPQGNAWFFVRSFELDENRRPISYDPFWARELVDDLAKAEARTPEQPATGNVAPMPPYFSGPNMLGDLSEAVRMPCPECGEESRVVGMRQLGHWSEHDDRSVWKQSLYVFCVSCPTFSRFAHREDKKPVILRVRE